MGVDLSGVCLKVLEGSSFVRNGVRVRVEIDNSACKVSCIDGVNKHAANM